ARKSSTASSPMARQSSVPGIALVGARGAARGRLADVDVRAGCLAGDGPAEGQERDSARAEPGDERLPLRAVGVYGHVERVPVIEAETIVRRRLTERADGERAMEGLGEEALERRGDLSEPPLARYSRAASASSDGIAAGVAARGARASATSASAHAIRHRLMAVILPRSSLDLRPRRRAQWRSDPPGAARRRRLHVSAVRRLLPKRLAHRRRRAGAGAARGGRLDTPSA